VALTQCVCDLTLSLSRDSQSSYQYTNGTLTTADGDNYASCIAGNLLNYRDNSGDGGIPGIYVLNRQ
jgi:hypothetical protein